MMDDMNPEKNALRRRAEQRWQEQKPEDGTLSEVDTKKIIHELQVHQIELEMQNEELQRTMGELSELTEKYADFYDLSPVGYLTLAEAGHVLEANLTAATLLGVERVWLVKKPFDLVVHPAARVVLRPFLEKIFSEGGKQTCELQILNKGLFIDLESMCIIDNASDGTKRCRVVMVDITERKQAEKQMRQSEERLRSVLDNSRDVIYRLNVQAGSFEYISPAVKDITGFSPDELMAQDTGTALAMIHPEDLPVMRAALERLQETGQADVVYRLRAKSGDYIWMSNHMNLTRDSTGQPLYREGNIRDITERKLPKETLLESESTLRTFFDSPGMLRGIVEVVDDEIRYVSACRATAAVYGLTPETMCGKFMSEQGVPSEVTREYRDRGEEARRTGQAVSFEMHRHFTDGDRWLLVTVSYLGTGSTGCPRFTYASLDVTERKRIEEDLHRSEERYRALFDGMTEGFAIHEIITDEQDIPVDYRFLDINSAFERLTGLKREDVVGKTHSEVLPENDPKWVQMYGAVALTGKPVQFENYSPALKRHYEVLAYRPAPRQFAVIFMDITERKNREKEKERFNRTLRALSKSNQAMMRASDESTYMQEVCKIIVEDCGHVMVWIGFAEKDESKTVHPVAYSGFEQGYIDALKITWTNTERGCGPTGTAIRTGEISTCRNILTDPLFKPWREEAIKRGYASSIVLPLMSGGKAFGALNIYSREPDPFIEDEVKLLTELASDLSYGIMAIRSRAARAKAEETLNEQTVQLENANKELESFSYSVSHDLRAPLRAIDGFSRMILRRDGESFSDDTKRQLQVIRDNVEKMGNLIDSLLDFSRLGRQEVGKSNVLMVDLVQEVWEEMVTINPGREMTMKMGPLPTAEGDKALIRQVYGNLLGNAVKFTQGRDVAEIEAGSCVQDGETVYYIRDNGVGFDMKYYEKLFGVFQRLHSDEEYKGTGIGLALVKRIVNRHGGRVWAEGEVNQGATFYFSLPKSHT